MNVSALADHAGAMLVAIAKDLNTSQDKHEQSDKSNLDEGSGNSHKATSSDPLGHLGLGLYISERIVHAHEGSIEVDSSASGGTTFKILLPRGMPNAA